MEYTDHMKATASCILPTASRSARKPWNARSGLFLILKWSPLLLLPVLQAVLAHGHTGWVSMCAMALTMFIGAKWLTLFRLLNSTSPLPAPRLLEYAFLWPGMDAEAFCGPHRVQSGSFSVHAPLREWLLAAAKTLAGAILVWLVLPSIGQNHPLLTAWAGIAAILLFAHFGWFHLLSLFWRARGVDARPIMNSPLTSTSLGRFWGNGWNRAFADLMSGYFLRPLARRLGQGGALAAIFLLSGLWHELVISFPAGGGYGLPTAYFALQGLGLYLERSPSGRRLGLGRGWKGWLYVVLFAGIPALGLFHPIFLRSVILPMLDAIGAN
jgi:hypothetical protein